MLLKIWKKIIEEILQKVFFKKRSRDQQFRIYLKKEYINTISVRLKFLKKELLVLTLKSFTAIE